MSKIRLGQLPVVRLYAQALLDSNDLCVTTENTVFVAVSAWLAARGNDAAAAAKLAQLLRFPQLTSAFLIEAVPQVREKPPCPYL